MAWPILGREVLSCEFEHIDGAIAQHLPCCPGDAAAEPEVAGLWYSALSRSRRAGRQVLPMSPLYTLLAGEGAHKRCDAHGHHHVLRHTGLQISGTAELDLGEWQIRQQRERGNADAEIAALPTGRCNGGPRAAFRTCQMPLAWNHELVLIFAQACPATLARLRRV
ncbi:hypothetical protein D9M70_386430 [compost metagenome]